MSGALAIIYKWELIGVPVDHPLHGIVYIGQSVRTSWKVSNVNELLIKRNGEHASCAKTKPSEYGLYAAIAMYGLGAFRTSIIESTSGDSVDYLRAHWANPREKSYIKEYGGPLLDMSTPVKISQTLNLTKGGTGVNGSQLSQSNCAMSIVLAHLRSYIRDHPERGANVPTYYVAPCGYPLGERVHTVRKRLFVDGRWVAKLEALPKWTWNGKQADEFKESFRNRVNRGIALAGGQSAVTKRQHEHPERYEKFRASREENTRIRRAAKRALLSPEDQIKFDKKCRANDHSIANRQKKKGRCPVALRS